MTQPDYEQLFLQNKAAISKAASLSCPKWLELEEWNAELMLRIWSKIRSYDASKGRITTWIYTIAFRFASQQKTARCALKRSAHKTRSIHGMRIKSGGDITLEPTDYRNETPEQIDRRLDLQSTISTMIRSDQEFIATIMNGSKDGDFARAKGFSRQRVNQLRERALGRLHRKLVKTPYGPRRDV